MRIKKDLLYRSLSYLCLTVAFLIDINFFKIVFFLLFLGFFISISSRYIKNNLNYYFLLALATFYFIGSIDYGIILEYNQTEISYISRIAIVLFVIVYHTLMISVFDVSINIKALRTDLKNRNFNHKLLFFINVVSIAINIAVIGYVISILGKYTWGDEYRRVLGRVIPGELTIFSLLVIILFHFNTLFILRSKSKTIYYYYIFNLLIIFQVFLNSSRSSFVFLFIPSFLLFFLIKGKTIFKLKYLVIGIALLSLSSFWGYYRLMNRPRLNFTKIVQETGFPVEYIVFYDAVVTFRGSIEIYNKVVTKDINPEYGSFLFRPINQLFNKGEYGPAQYVARKYVGRTWDSALPPTLVGGFYIDFRLFGCFIGPLLMLFLFHFFKTNLNILSYSLGYTYLVTYYMISIYGNFFNNIGFPLTLVIYLGISFLLFTKFKWNITA
ncbi:O-antigen polymerase [uncultured Algibacter sp.]|uniref:O-antigen polymerase n=1 Tax=uncultured Algibacter sp. TaxID=298659 RepID=UPI00260A9E3D|nr:O-antigen polymerase [uncultured Algibacter sp.]